MQRSAAESVAGDFRLVLRPTVETRRASSATHPIGQTKIPCSRKIHDGETQSTADRIRPHQHGPLRHDHLQGEPEQIDEPLDVLEIQPFEPLWRYCSWVRIHFASSVSRVC